MLQQIHLWAQWQIFPSDAFDKVMNNNIKANHILTNLVTPQMIERKDGVIIIISSVGRN